MKTLSEIIADLRKKGVLTKLEYNNYSTVLSFSYKWTGQSVGTLKSDLNITDHSLDQVNMDLAERFVESEMQYRIDVQVRAFKADR